MRKKLFFKGIIPLAAMLFGVFLNGQVQIRHLPDFGMALFDINSHGQALLGAGYYDFATDVISMPEDGVGATVAINDEGMVLDLFYDKDSGDYVPAVRVNGEWNPLPAHVNLTDEDALYDISNNGEWICGQTAWDMETNTSWGFVYNLVTEEFRLLEGAEYSYSAAYGVNNDGYAVGWVDTDEGGTHRMPALFAPDGEIILFASLDDEEDEGAAAQISDSGYIVGNLGDTAFVYHMGSDEIKTFAPEGEFWSYTFTGVSEDGVTVGYGEMPGFSRIPMVYHPSWDGIQTVSAWLVSQGVDPGELEGAAYKISTDGKYVCGFGNGPAFMAPGWAVYFDDALEGGNDEPYDCSQDWYDGDADVAIGFANGNIVANDVAVAANGSFLVETITFDMVALGGEPTEFDLILYNDNGTGGVGSETGYTVHFDSSNMSVESLGLLWDAYPMFRIEAELPEGGVLLENDTDEVKFYWFGIAAATSTSGDFTYWASHPYNQNVTSPAWQYTTTEGQWFMYIDSTGGAKEGFFKAEGVCSGTVDDGPDPEGCEWTVHVWDDFFGDEVTWNLKDDATGIVLLSGGSYGDGYDVVRTVIAEGPVTFFISADGFFGDNTPSYTVSNGVEILVEGALLGGDERTYAGLACDDGVELDCPINYESAMDDGLGDVSVGIVLAADFVVEADEEIDMDVLRIYMIGGVDSVDISFYEDAADMLGAEIMAPATVVPVAQVPVNYDGETTVIYELELDMSAYDLTFSGGADGTKYWMAVTTNSAEANYWAESTGVHNGTNFFVSLDDYETWDDAGDFGFEVDGAFSINCEGLPAVDVPSCFLNIFFVEPITRVAMANVDNPSDSYSEEGLEDFTDISINVSSGESYEITVEGNTMGEFDNYFAAFIDTSAADENEWTSYLTYEIGSIFNSDGEDGVQATGIIDIPESLANGDYTFRVIKNFGDMPMNPCGEYFWGQAEDYTLHVGPTTSGGDCGVSYESAMVDGLGDLAGGIVLAADFPVAANTSMAVTKTNIFMLNDVTGIEISFYEDSANGPGAQIVAPTFIIPTSQTTAGTTANGTPIYDIELDLSGLNLILNSTETEPVLYWMGVTTVAGAAGSNFWAHTFDIHNGTNWYGSLDNYGSWDDVGAFGFVEDGAFSIEGDCTTLGLIDELTSFDFAYYPNPVNDVLNITASKKVESVQAFNLAGQQVLNTGKGLSNSNQINVSNLPTGVYIFRTVLADGAVETFKIIKK